MVKVLDMQFIRYVNLFNNITKIKTNHCFEYNNTIVFVVPKEFVMRAIGNGNMNLERLSSVIGRKVKIISDPRKTSNTNCSYKSRGICRDFDQLYV